MKLADIRKKTADELQGELKDLKSELFHLRFQHAINQLDNPLKIAQTRKDIARIMTVIREKEIEAQKQSAAQ